MTRRDRYLQKKYGITEGEYAALLEWGNGGCWICGRLPKGRRLHVEHDHKTGRVRGLTCWPCNEGLQKFRDDPLLLVNASIHVNSLQAQDIINDMRKD